MPHPVLPLPRFPASPQTLVSVSTIGTLDDLSEQQLVDTVKAELGGWFGADEVAGWQHLKTYRIPFAQPNQVGGGVGCSRHLGAACSAGSC